jgi:hypothetical protein
MALSGKCDHKFHLLFLKLDDIWHRFYLDAGLLFWEEGAHPELEDELLEGEGYVDLGERLRVLGGRIAEILMGDCKLLLRFDNGARLVLRNGPQDDGAEVVEESVGHF